ncbi:S1/P1 nuclease [Sphingomicrobium lutaoense]|uniref:S1/P1 Nuclease n=1 Tax=Sphingomicrobium lutaoense TaxID=515949 RepID=A0A839YXG1_9SPHN|nr:S1/P1 nuclease [Sphingomicrobium lutaoense]MBB3764881.1 hypothetical protein [Sphingomicrobium lutaoense]
MMRWLAGLLAALGLAFAAPATAYWEYGHGVVARIALDNVRPETRAEIRRLMAQDELLQTPTCRIASIEDAAYWPDCIKRLGDRYAYAFSWHYQNVNICEPFDLSGPCKDGNCVAAQIERNARLLADRELPTRARVEALAFLLHFVGDLHQPMHAGDKGDLGGNRVDAHYGHIKGTNLHAIWDGYLAERAISTPPGGAEGLLSGYHAEEIAAMAGGNVVDWSREMWAVARDHAYPSLLDRDPCAGDVEEAATLSEEDVDRLIPVARESVVKGGLRLARLLDEAIVEGKAPPFRRF